MAKVHIIYYIRARCCFFFFNKVVFLNIKGHKEAALWSERNVSRWQTRHVELVNTTWCVVKCNVKGCEGKCVGFLGNA